MSARAEFAAAGTSPFPRFLLLHALLVPGAFALAAAVAQFGGLDQQLAGAFFDPAAGAFPARDSMPLEVLGHRFAKSAVLLLWFTLLAAAAAASLLRLLPGRDCAVLWATAGAMALGPAIVVVLKGLNSHPCPWSLRAYGGLARLASDWFVPAAEAGHCFPSGHAAAGFSLVALSLAGMARGAKFILELG